MTPAGFPSPSGCPVQLQSITASPQQFVLNKHKKKPLPEPGHSSKCMVLQCLKTLQWFLMFLSILIEFVSDGSHNHIKSCLQSWPLGTFFVLNATSKSVDIHGAMCLKQDSKSVFLFLEKTRQSLLTPQKLNGWFRKTFFWFNFSLQVR